MKRFSIRVEYQDRRQGPSSWRTTVQAGTICAAIARGVREFWKRATWTGRGPSRELSVKAVRLP